MKVVIEGLDEDLGMMWGFIKLKVGTDDRLGEVVTWRG
jgi:hypothetical protein